MESERGIGETARACGLPVSALRFYDSAGVLPPARADPHTGYRWYGDAQLRAARLVARLRRVGLPLDELRQVLAHQSEPHVVEQVLSAHLRRLEDGLAEARRELSAVRTLLDDPENPVSSLSTTVTTTGTALAEALRRVRYAVGSDPALPALAGVLLDVDAGGLSVVATDRYRLAVRPVAGAVAGPALRALVPVTLVDEAVAALTGVDALVTLTVEGARVRITGERLSLEAALLDEDFPDYRSLLPGVGEHAVDLDVAAFRQALTAAPLRTVPRGDGGSQEAAVLTLTDDGGLALTPADGPMKLGVDRAFLLDALDASGSAQLVLHLDGPLSPLALREPGVGGLDLLMPIRLP